MIIWFSLEREDHDYVVFTREWLMQAWGSREPRDILLPLLVLLLVLVVLVFRLITVLSSLAHEHAGQRSYGGDPSATDEFLGVAASSKRLAGTM
ncbi:hypothetical protein U1Q18_007740 [Sarracenia purpurea var. burkii]